MLLSMYTQRIYEKKKKGRKKGRNRGYLVTETKGRNEERNKITKKHLTVYRVNVFFI